MPVTVEDGTGLTASDSYIDEAYVLAYLTARNRQTAWAAASAAVQEANLYKAMDYLTNTFRGSWKGSLYSDAQALQFPRQNYVDEEGRIPDPVPTELKDAQAELADLALTQSLTENLAADTGTVKSERDKLDVIETETVYAGGKRSQPRFIQVERLITYLLKVPPGSVALVRA